MPGFYLFGEDQWGFIYAPERLLETTPRPAWEHFAVPPTPDPPNVNAIGALTCSPESPDSLRVIWGDDTLCRISTNGGTSWGAQGSVQPTPEVLTPDIFCMESRDASEVYLYNTDIGNAVANQGVLRSLNSGLTWTKIIALSELSGSYIAVGTTKLWFAQRTGSTTGPPPTRTWSFRRANFDGTGLETVASYTFTQNTASGISLPAELVLRATSDDFVLATSFPARAVILATSSGTATDIRPTGLYRPWETMALTNQVFLAVGQPQPGTTASNDDVLIYRTANAGSSWTLQTTIPAAQGFALSGVFASGQTKIDGYGNDAYVLGNAAIDVQQIVWLSSDAGVNWTSIVNEAEPGSTGDWSIRGPGGLKARRVPSVQVAIPSRLATIVG